MPPLLRRSIRSRSFYSDGQHRLPPKSDLDLRVVTDGRDRAAKNESARQLTTALRFFELTFDIDEHVLTRSTSPSSFDAEAYCPSFHQRQCLCGLTIPFSSHEYSVAFPPSRQSRRRLDNQELIDQSSIDHVKILSI